MTDRAARIGHGTPALATLARGRRRRAWSLIVTIMGDLTRDDGRALPGAFLRATLAHLDVSPEAARTALHRLRADGWVETARMGRASTHRLSPHALGETRAVAPRVYGPGPAMPDRWSLVTADLVPGAVALGRCLFLRAGGLGDDPGLAGDALRLSEAHRATLWPPALRADCAALGAALGAADLPSDPAPDLAAALRALVVHDWRRIVLRGPALPDALAPPTWAATRSAVGAALRRLPAGRARG